MTKANLSEANLSLADLRGALLQDVTLTGANLGSADLRSAKLRNVDLRGADLSRTDLRAANLVYVDLRNAELIETDLRNAYLWRVNLMGAQFFLANVDGTFISLDEESAFPGMESWFYIRNLSSLRVEVSPYTLRAFQRLREEFKSAGLRNEERDITAIIQRSRTDTHGHVERSFRYILFDVPANYGASPGRPLLIVVAGIFFLALPYSAALWIRRYDQRGGIWKVWQSDRLLDRDRESGDERERLFGLPVWKALLYGLYFSMLSTCHFGWRDLNVGNWMHVSNRASTPCAPQGGSVLCPASNPY